MQVRKTAGAPSDFDIKNAFFDWPHARRMFDTQRMRPQNLVFSPVGAQFSLQNRAKIDTILFIRKQNRTRWVRDQVGVVGLHLKSLELQGFKSFPDKTVLTFGDGITAIVGPNGSGKSNISDAVRWVLGEQSTRTLRGNKMEDVIFGGTQKRGPVGYAEVSLTIDNSDGVLPTEYNEVTITRRYYRSGDSEFYINRSAVRLRDIHELLMDTGLGRDGYSIIGQGRIDEILSLKSEDRREIFEEASGISKFRHRKEEAERKLNATEENLVRIRDIISELESQVGPLAKQAEQAKRYLKIHEELKSLEINVWMYTLDKIRENAVKYQNDFQVAVSQFERSQALVDELYAQAEAISTQMREKDVEVEKVRESLRQEEDELRAAESEISLLGGSIENNRHNIERVEAELSDEENRAGGIRSQIEERSDRIKTLKEQERGLEGKIEDLASRIETAAKSTDDVSAQLDSLRARKQELETQAGERRIELSAAATAYENHRSRQQELEEELSQREVARDETKEKADGVRRAFREAEEECESINNVLSGFALKGKAREERLQELRESHQKLAIQVESMSQKLHMLQEMERDFQGYSHAVKAIMRAGERGELGGVHGAVSKLMRVPDEYTVAVETTLGAALQHIVVEDEKSAKSAISFLKSCNGGRATLLPLTTIRANELREQKLNEQEGFVGIACDLVQFEERYRGIFKNLLGRIVVADNLHNASNIARAYQYRFRIVTLDGQLINAGGSYTGGSVSKSAGILSRANEISRLTESIGKKQARLRELTEEKDEAEREHKALAYEIEVYQNDKRRAEDTLLKARTEIEHYKLLMDNLNAAIDGLQDELINIRAKQTEASKERERLGGELAALTEEADGRQKEIDELLQGHAELIERKDALSDQLGELRLRCAAVKSEYVESEKALEELNALRHAMEGDRQAKEQLIGEYRAKIRELEEQIQERQGRLAERTGAIAAIHGHIAQLNQEKLDLEALRNKKDKESKDKNDEILRLERERSRLESKKDAVELEEKQITDKLWETYELTVMGAQEIREPLESVTEAKARVSELKSERKKLGNVNVGAIEEYDRVSERFSFLSEQRDDLEKSKNELTRMIDDLTGEMKEIFAEQFAVINQNFSETFTEIFGGGKAELRLEDPSDILNCGIEIKVQPPGKTLRTITLLSGGERAFVAIALYFAIMKVRPTPFCVLDEIEAALDDVNVARYAAYLRKLTATTQFIVITHRRGTMEEADVLYGVTMQEQGISKMLTISIAEVERELHIKLK